MIGGHADDVHRSAEAADQHSSLAGHRANHDRLGVHIDCHGADCMGNGVQIVLAGKLRIHEALLIVSLLFSIFCDLCHGADSLHRELTRSSLTGINILGVSELKWTGMDEFNSDDHYIYYHGQEEMD